LACFTSKLVLVSIAAERLYECIDVMAERLCSSTRCAKPARPAWLIYARGGCLIKVSTPQPRQASSTGLPPPVSAAVVLECGSPESLVEEAKRILAAATACKGVGVVLEAEGRP
jgi:hypothetical protein